jgi:hypothetical protein
MLGGVVTETAYRRQHIAKRFRTLGLLYAVDGWSGLYGLTPRTAAMSALADASAAVVAVRRAP